jgi:chromate transport protein ChrA
LEGKAMTNQIPGAQAPRPQSAGGAQRVQIDVETLRGLLIANGGGAVALLLALSPVIDRAGFEPLVYTMFIGIVVFMVGVVLAVLYHHFRRQCSQQVNVPGLPHGSFLGIRLRAPAVCVAYQVCLYLSLLCFIGTGAYVAWVGASTVGAVQASSSKGPGASKAGTTKAK